MKFTNNIFLEPIPILPKENHYPPTSIINAETIKMSYLSDLLVKQDKSTLEEVVVKTRVKTPLQKIDERYAGNGLFGGEGRMGDVMNDRFAVRTKNLADCITYLFPTLIVGGNNGLVDTKFGVVDIDIFLDERKVTFKEIMDYPVSSIAYMKRFSGPFVLTNSPGGALAIYTKKGEDIYNDPTLPTLNSFKFTRYSLIKEFYNPNYSQSQEAPKPDLRTTLYWNPWVMATKEKSYLKFKFYNNDISKSFRIVLEGINEKGQLVHVEKIFTEKNANDK